MRPRLLDLFCGAGGCAVGYHHAGFDVVGVDIKPQPHYPFEFYQADALEFAARHYTAFDMIHASPVCKGYSSLAALWNGRVYPDQITEVRDFLIQTGLPFVIENVEGAPLKNYVMLCSSMFGLRVYRHRLFECDPQILLSPASCNHSWRASGNAYRNGQKRRSVGSFANSHILTVTGHDFIVSDARSAMGIDWMTRDELSQAVPWVYTE